MIRFVRIKQTTHMEDNEKLLENPEFLAQNEVSETELTTEEKNTAVNYDELTEEEKQELDELLKQQAKKPQIYWGKPRKKITAKENKVKKRRRREVSASRRKNRK